MVERDKVNFIEAYCKRNDAEVGKEDIQNVINGRTPSDKVLPIQDIYINEAIRLIKTQEKLQKEIEAYEREMLRPAQERNEEKAEQHLREICDTIDEQEQTLSASEVITDYLLNNDLEEFTETMYNEKEVDSATMDKLDALRDILATESKAEQAEKIHDYVNNLQGNVPDRVDEIALAYLNAMEEINGHEPMIPETKEELKDIFNRQEEEKTVTVDKPDLSYIVSAIQNKAFMLQGDVPDLTPDSNVLLAIGNATDDINRYMSQPTQINIADVKMSCIAVDTAIDDSGYITKYGIADNKYRDMETLLNEHKIEEKEEADLELIEEITEEFDDILEHIENEIKREKYAAKDREKEKVYDEPEYDYDAR